MKVVINYDPATGAISGKNGVVVMWYAGLDYEEFAPTQSSSTIDLATVLAVALHPEAADKYVSKG